jgi:hypothetical protein
MGKTNNRYPVEVRERAVDSKLTTALDNPPGLPT